MPSAPPRGTPSSGPPPSAGGPGARPPPTPRLVILTGLDVRAFRGGEKYAATLGRELAARGAQVLLYSKVDPHEKLRLSEARLPLEVGVPVEFYRLGWVPLLPPVPWRPNRFLDVLRSADTIFTLESTPRFVALVVVLGHLLGRRVVVGLHHPSQAEELAAELARGGSIGTRARLFRYFLRKADAIHTINAGQAATLRDCGIDQNVAMVHSFTTARPVSRAPGARSSELTALFVGPLEREQKGIDLLVDVGRRVLARRSDVRLRVVGVGPDEPLVRELAGQYPSRVELLGFVAEGDLPGVYASADLFWLTSRAESFSLVALEAFTQGVPVISFAIPGLEDVTSIFPEGRVAAFDVDAFAAKVLDLLELRQIDPARFAEIVERCRTEAIRRFGTEVLVPRLAQMLGLSLPGPTQGSSPPGPPPGPPP